MEIIFVCTRSITFNTFLSSQAEYLSKKGYKIKIACSDTENLIFKKSLNYKIDFPTKYIHLINIFRFIKIFFQINEIVKNNKSSKFYLHTPVASYLFRFFTMFNKIKILYFVHGFRFTSKTTRKRAIIYKFIEKFLSFNTNVYITINNEDYNYAKNNLYKKVPIFKINGVGLDLKKKIPNLKFKYSIKNILVVAGYKRSKGYDNLIKAAELLKNKKLRIDCYGYGNFSKYNLIKLKKNLKNIHFKKFNLNLKKKIRKYDILLHLSKREGLPVAIMESLIEGLPVICNRIRGNVDLIKDNYNGLFVRSFKDVPNKICYLNLEIKIFNKMRKNALKTIDQSYSKMNVNKSIYKIVKSI